MLVQEALKMLLSIDNGIGPALIVLFSMLDQEDVLLMTDEPTAAHERVYPKINHGT